MNRHGAAGAAWSSYFNVIRSAMFVPGSGWSATQSRIGAADGENPLLAMGEDGEAIALWHVSPSGRPDVRRLVSATVSRDAWSAPVPISSEGVPAFRSLVLVMDGQGNATAAWVQSERRPPHSTPPAVWVSRRPRGEVWGQARPLEVLPHLEAWALVPLAAAANDAGQVAVVWESSSGLRSAHFLPATGSWTDAEPVRGTYPPRAELRMKMDAIGRLVLVWSDWGRMGALTYAPQTGWVDAPPARSMTNERSGHFALGMDGVGRAIVVWTRGQDGEERIVASRLVPGRGWAPIVVLSTPGVRAVYPAVAVSPSGDATAVWLEDAHNDPRDEIWAATYRAQDP
jgi:hypothetical protein